MTELEKLLTAQAQRLSKEWVRKGLCDSDGHAYQIMSELTDLIFSGTITVDENGEFHVRKDEQ